MVLNPRLVGVLLPSRSNWKPVVETDIFVLQHNVRQGHNPYRIITRGFPHYRVAEGDSIELLQEELGNLSHNARSSIQGKITSKKIASWLKGSNTPNASSQPDQSQHEDDDEDIQDEEGYLSDLSTVSNEEMGRTYNTLVGSGRLLRRAISLEDIKKGSTIPHLMLHDDPLQRPVSSASVSPPIPSDTLPADRHLLHDHEHHQLEPPYELDYPHYAHSTYTLPNRARSAMSMRQHDDNYTLYNVDSYHNGHPSRSRLYERDTDDNLTMYGSRSGYAHQTRSGDEAAVSGADKDEQTASGPLGWLNASPILDAIVSWVEGPVDRPAVKKNDKPNPVLDIPFQFIALLTYPEPDSKAGNKMSLAMVRETAFVRQRRKTLLMLTAYTLVVRYCSFDFFLVLLFASNCGLLFLMKNSGRMNVNMAKRAVNQRVGWAKQWAGGIFRRGHGGGSGQDTSVPHNQNGTSSNTISTKSQPASLATQAESIRGGVAPSIAGEKEITPEEGKEVKKRGLFGKRKTTNPTSTAPTVHGNSATAAQNGSGAIVPTAFEAGHGGDEASIMTGRTQKRGFFKRSSSGTASRSATAPPGTIPIIAMNGAPTKSTTAPTSLAAGASSQTASIAPQQSNPTQSSPQTQQIPTRSPSPSALRRETASPKPWAATPPPPPSIIQQHQPQPQLVDSPPSSGTASMSSSPKAMPTVISLPQPIRSLSSMHPRSFLAGFSLSQKQQNYPKSTHTPSSTATNNLDAATAPVTATMPISPRPLNVTGLSVPPSILTNAAVDHLEVLSHSGVAYAEGDDMEEASECLLPASKITASPEALRPTATVPSLLLSSFPSRHQENSSQKPTILGSAGYSLKEGILDNTDAASHDFTETTETHHFEAWI